MNNIFWEADYAVKLTRVADNLFLLSTATSNHIKTYMHLKEHTKTVYATTT